MAELKHAGKIRLLGPRLYTSVSPSREAEVVFAEWSRIVSTLFPHALLSHRTALEYRPSPDGKVYLSANTQRSITYAKLTLVFLKGPKPLPDDPRFLSTLRASSLARSLLENLSPIRGKDKNKNLPIEELEQKLELHLHQKGEVSLRKIRDRAQEIAQTFGWHTAFKRLNTLIGALLGSREMKFLKSQNARARALGRPFDRACLNRLEILFGELRHYPWVPIIETRTQPVHFKNKAFFESYFSNYIEGTQFEIEEAEKIIFDHQIPAQFPKDAHDILRTFQIVSNLSALKQTPRDYIELLHLLRSRHHTLMQKRPEVNPGLFKSKPNRAGNTVFVHPSLVEGSLEKGLDLYLSLPDGLARAIFMMVLVSEIHPFTDGNGRIARIMMNAELHAERLVSIIIPTVFREDYIGALRALTRRNRPKPLIEMMIRAHRFSNLDFSDYPAILETLESRNWFQEPEDAQIREDGS
jgi:fido (protein-threonine AMPylation protein)